MDFEKFVSLIKNLDSNKKCEDIKEDRHIFGFYFEKDGQIPNPRFICGPGVIFLDSKKPESAVVIVATNEPINSRYEAFLGTYKTLENRQLLIGSKNGRYFSGNLVDMPDSLANKLEPLVESLWYIPEGPRKLWPELETLRVDTIYKSQT